MSKTTIIDLGIDFFLYDWSLELFIILSSRKTRKTWKYQETRDFGVFLKAGTGKSFIGSLILKAIYAHSDQKILRPELSKYRGRLTYPERVDAADTQSPPDLRGLQDFMIFVNHHEPETEISNVLDRDFNPNSSKKKMFEAQMTLQCVRYLGQQGYGTDKIVGLTQYCTLVNYVCSLTNYASQLTRY